MNKNKFDIEPKPLEQIPINKKNELEYVQVDVKKPEVKLNISDYFNIIKAFLMNRSLEEMKFEEKTNYTLILWLILIIVIAITILAIIK